MRVTTGKVVDGKVVVEGEPLAEGSAVTVVAREDEETFELGPEDEAELREPTRYGGPLSAAPCTIPALHEARQALAPPATTAPFCQR